MSKNSKCWNHPENPLHSLRTTVLIFVYFLIFTMIVYISFLFLCLFLYFEEEICAVCMRSETGVLFTVVYCLWLHLVHLHFMELNNKQSKQTNKQKPHKSTLYCPLFFSRYCKWSVNAKTLKPDSPGRGWPGSPSRPPVWWIWFSDAEAGVSLDFLVGGHREAKVNFVKEWVVWGRIDM